MATTLPSARNGSAAPAGAATRRRAPFPFTLAPATEPATSGTLHRELCAAARRAILSGQLPPGARLPSSRQVALDLGISRSTVILAFELLAAEGYLRGAAGSGTFVADALPVPARDAIAAPAPPDTGRPRRQPEISRRGRLMAAAQPFSRFPSEAFAPGRPDVALFPFELWSRLEGRTWRRPPAHLVDCADPRGYRPLRAAIATYLRAVRAVNCTADQVIVTSGAQQGHDLVARTLLDPGDRAWCEDPGYGPARVALAAAGAVTVPVPLDAAGISVADGRAIAPAARLVSIAPSHQYPLGSVMPLSRRLEVLRWASEANAWVIEDDYDSEFRYNGRPLASLQGLDRENRVILVGSFSKVLLPSMRLGYLVVPERVAEAFARARAIGDQHPPIWHQPVLARFIEEGYLAGHLRRLRRVYNARRQSFLAARHELDGLLEVASDDIGLHLVGHLAPELGTRLRDVEAVARARRAGIHSAALSSFYAGPAPREGLVLGYACVAEADMRARVRQLAAALRGS